MDKSKIAGLLIIIGIPIIFAFIVRGLFGVAGWESLYSVMSISFIFILPLLASSIGGLIAGYFKLRKKKNEKMLVSLIALLPFFVSPKDIQNNILQVIKERSENE